MVKMETTCSQQNRRMLLGLRALRHCILSADHLLKLGQHEENNLHTQNGRSGQCWRFGLASALHSSETGFQACAQHICAVEERQETVRPQPNSSVFQFSPRLLTPLPLFSDEDNDLRGERVCGSPLA